MKAKKRVKAGTSKQETAKRKALFVEAYVTNGGNATQAALTAGYSKGCARRMGTRLATDSHIAQQIAARRAEVVAQAQEKTQLTADEVIASLARDIRFDPAKLYNEDGSLKRITEIDEDTRLALRGIEVTEIAAEGAVLGYTKKVKFPEKTAAREQGMKKFGLYEVDNRQRAPLTVNAVALTVEMSFDKVLERARAGV